MKGYETIEGGRMDGKKEPCLEISDSSLQRWCMLFAVVLQTVCSNAANRFAVVLQWLCSATATALQ